MIYDFKLHQVAFVLSLFYILGHGWALMSQEAARKFLISFPRNEKWGQFLFGVSSVWFIYLLVTVDLMEFTPYKNHVIIAFAILILFAFFYLTEFMSVRALGAILLLLAHVMLDSAFLVDNPMELFITVLAYLYIISGMFMVASPWILRDVIGLITQGNFSIKGLSIAGIGYGFILLLLSLFVY